MQKRIGQTTDMIDGFKDMIESPDPDWTEEEKKIAKIFEERMKKIEELKSMASTALNFAEKVL